ncbi:MAG: hypothetical protein ACREP7_17565, partial [Lysobacter sp.]
LVQYNSIEVGKLKGRHSRDIEALIGFRYGESVMHRDDLVLVGHDALPGDNATPQSHSDEVSQ